MKKIKFIVLGCLLIYPFSSMASIYLGTKLGTTGLNNACHTSKSCDKSGTTVGELLGYDFNDWFALEGGYDYLGKFNGSGLENETIQAYTLAPKFTYQLNSSWGVYGKFGTSRVRYGEKLDNSYLGAVGIAHTLSSNVNLRLEYQYLSDLNNHLVRANANTVTLGLVYHLRDKSQDYHFISPAETAHAVTQVSDTQQESVIKAKTYKQFKSQNFKNETFAYNSTKLRASTKIHLGNIVKFLKVHQQAQITITGYTDSIGSKQYNQQLSEKRAQTVVQFLQAQGISSDRIHYQGKGENYPIVSNKTKAGRNKNRRIEITVHYNPGIEPPKFPI